MNQGGSILDFNDSQCKEIHNIYLISLQNTFRKPLFGQFIEFGWMFIVDHVTCIQPQFEPYRWGALKILA